MSRHLPLAVNVNIYYLALYTKKIDIFIGTIKMFNLALILIIFFVKHMYKVIYL